MRTPSNAVQRAGLLGLGIAAAAAAVFMAAAGTLGQVGVARYGGGAWVFILAWIITMPVLAPWLRERAEQ
ncbi:MAG TPA: hypothetical protein VI007_09805 [bacterium]